MEWGVVTTSSCPMIRLSVSFSNSAVVAMVPMQAAILLQQGLGI